MVAQTSAETSSGSESLGSETFDATTTASESESGSGSDETGSIPEQLERR